MKSGEALELLKNEFIFYSQWCPVQSQCSPYSRVRVSYDKALEEKTKKIARRHRDMWNAGVKIHTLDISTGWYGGDEIDTTDIDRVLDAFFAACPDGYLIPRINQFDASNEWLYAHPTEIFVFEQTDGASPQELRKMIGTDRQAISGAGGTRVEGIAFQSFASDLWKKSVEDILRKVIRHFEESPYADRIIGYHMGYGRCGETHFWGNGIDYSQPNKKKFYEFGMEKYGSQEKLAQAWGVDDVSPTNVPLPKEADLTGKAGDLKEFLNTGKQAHRDYFEYLSHLAYSLVDDFGGIIKEMTGKVVGFFHGYFLWGDSQTHGYRDVKWLLDNPNIDFMAAPKAYYRTGYGEPGGSHTCPGSINRKKLWIDENDSRTYRVYELEDPTGESIFMCGGGAKNVEETKWVMWREFARNEMSGSAMWWMDLGGDWYDDPELLKEMEKIYAAKRQIRERKRESIAEILIVYDEEMCLHAKTNTVFDGRANLDTVAEAASCGAPYDLYRFDELTEIDLSQYKLAVFLNPEDITAEKFNACRFAPGTRFLWNYLPGGSEEEAEKVVGMRIRETGRADDFPYLEILPEERLDILETYKEPPKDMGIGMFRSREQVRGGALTLQNLPKEGIRTATKGVHTVCTVPAPRKELIRKLGEEAGCRFYAPVGQYVYSDSRFIAVFHEGGFRFTVV